MSTSQNGWPALPADSAHLHTWVVPATTGKFSLRLRDGSAGFLLAHYALWYAETIEPVAGKVLDDWGYAWRSIRGQSHGLSNHASGTAIDLNASRHPLGRTGTLAQRVKGLSAASRILTRLATTYRGALRWGGSYHGRKDEMHTEVVASIDVAEKLARRLMTTSRGKRLLVANSNQRKVINS